MTSPQEYFNFCKNLSIESNCLSRKIGAIIVSPDGSILSSGYNHSPLPYSCDLRYTHDLSYITIPKQTPPKDIIKTCPRKLLHDPTLRLCPAIHAEVMAIYNCPHIPYNSTLYINAEIPCKNCASLISMTGIKTIYHSIPKAYDKLGPIILKENKITLITI